MACDHVRLFRSDVELMRSIGLRHYRFSISWSRVMSWDPVRRRMVANEAGLRFYDALLEHFGAKRLMEIESFILWGKSFDEPCLAITRPFDKKDATVGNGVMVALQAESQDAVKALHAKALELGGADEGAPGPRGDGFYAGYFRDLDGNKLNAFVLG